MRGEFTVKFGAKGEVMKKAAMLMAVVAALMANAEMKIELKPGAGVTAAIQSAIDAASAKGGDTVVVPAGEWLAERLELKDNVTLKLE